MNESVGDCRCGDISQKQTIHSCATYEIPCACVFDARLQTVFLLQRMLLPLYCSFFKSYSRDYLCQREILGEIPLGKGARLRIRNLLYCIIFLKGLRNFLCHVECVLTLATLKFHVSFFKNLTFFAK